MADGILDSRDRTRAGFSLETLLNVALLRSHGQNDLWQLAADLAHRNFKPELLEHLFATLDAGTARAALVRISSSVEIAGLLNEIESSTSRISDLVGAIREYTFMDQAPVQNVDIVKTLETTLTILNHKLKRGVDVQRDYQKIPLRVNSFGSELNQVWTNIIDNAIDAMGGKGKLRVRTYREDKCVVVEPMTAQGFRPKSNLTFSSPSSPPREWERAPGLASIRCNAL